MFGVSQRVLFFLLTTHPSTPSHITFFFSFIFLVLLQHKGCFMYFYAKYIGKYNNKKKCARVQIVGWGEAHIYKYIFMYLISMYNTIHYYNLNSIENKEQG